MSSLTPVTTIPGNNVPPVSFPGIASGIDYNAIIEKLTQLTLAPVQNLQTEEQQLNDQNIELLKIQNLFANAGDALQALSNPATFQAISATTSNTSAATATQTRNGTGVPGTYTILQSTLATASSLTADPAANASANLSAPLISAGTSVTPSNGGATSGALTINGHVITYDVNSDSLNTILAKIQAVPGIASATFGGPTGDELTVTTTVGTPLTIGSASDSGNLAQVLKFDDAQVVTNANGSQTVTSTAGIGGINPVATFSSAGNGYKTAVSSGTFTINGVQFTVDATKDALSDVIAEINSSSAGVIASFDPASGQLVLTNKQTGPQSIVLGAAAGQPADTSNFFNATGLTTSAAKFTVGTQAKVQYVDPTGRTSTVYSDSNAVTNVIPGVTLTLLAATGPSNPYTVTVAQDPTALTTALNAFVSAYNAAINEINQATAAPVVSQSPAGSNPSGGDANQSTQSQSQIVTAGGILFDNPDVITMKDQLVELATSIVQNGHGDFNSLASIGLSLDSSTTVLTPSTSAGGSAGSAGSGGGVTTETLGGTSGELSPLNAATLSAALSANPAAVASIFTGASGLAQQLGAFLTDSTGLPVFLQNGPAGPIPESSTISNFEQTNTQRSNSIAQQISQIQDSANSQADQLRAEFVASEGQIAVLQSVQNSLGSLLAPVP